MKSIADVAHLLKRAGVKWALIGGHAVNAYLEPRFTADIDVTVVADPEGLQAVVNALREGGLKPVVVFGDEQPSGPDFIRFEDDAHTVLEVQVGKTALQTAVVERAIAYDNVRIATPEDLLILKAIANRPKDQADLQGLCRTPALDWAYVLRHAEAWDITSLVSALRKV